MSQFRKKPVVIEAVRNNGEWAPILAWLDRAGYTVPFLGKPAVTRNRDGSLSIETLEGTMRADVGDWIIKGVKGEFYPCKPDIFEATYEPVQDSAPGALDAQTLHDSPGSDCGCGLGAERCRAAEDGETGKGGW